MSAIFERTKSFSGFSFLSNWSSASGTNLWALCLFSMLEIWWQKLRLNYKKLLQWIGQNIRESCLKICNNSDMWIVLCSLGNATKEKLVVSVSRSVMSNSLWPNGLFMGFSRQGYWKIPFSRGSFQPRDQTQVSCIAGRFFTIWATREAQEKSWPEVEFPGLWTTIL